MVSSSTSGKLILIWKYSAARAKQAFATLSADLRRHAYVRKLSLAKLFAARINASTLWVDHSVSSFLYSSITRYGRSTVSSKFIAQRISNSMALNCVLSFSIAEAFRGGIISLEFYAVFTCRSIIEYALTIELSDTGRSTTLDARKRHVLVTIGTLSTSWRKEATNYVKNYLVIENLRRCYSYLWNM